MPSAIIWLKSSAFFFASFWFCFYSQLPGVGEWPKRNSVTENRGSSPIFRGGTFIWSKKKGFSPHHHWTRCSKARGHSSGLLILFYCSFQHSQPNAPENGDHFQTFVLKTLHTYIRVSFFVGISKHFQNLAIATCAPLLRGTIWLP